MRSDKVIFSESLRRYRIPLGVALVLLAALYRDILPGMVRQWRQDANYSHGFIVPLIAAYFVYQRRFDLWRSRVEPWWPGLTLFLLGLLQLAVGWLGAEFFTMRSSLVVTLAGMTLFLFGKQLFGLVLLPLTYLLFMVPLPYLVYDSIAFPLKFLVTGSSIALLRLCGVVVMSEGNVILLPLATLEVADACSGIRSLVSLLALATGYAFSLKITSCRKALLILSAVPIAVMANVFRVFGTGLLAEHFGARAAHGFFHEFAGLAVFTLAVALLLCLGAVLSGRGKGVA
jgi:exosortase